MVEHGVCFRYIPAGVFLMGSDASEPDEGPRHPVCLSAYWLSETTVSWATYCRLMDWEPPPWVDRATASQVPRSLIVRDSIFTRQLRFDFSIVKTIQPVPETGTATPGQLWNTAGKTKTAQELFGSPPRDEPDAPLGI